MARHVYTLLEVTPFAAPLNPGPTAVYTPFAMPAAMKMIDNAFICNSNYFKSLKNIHRACFCMLDKLVPNQFKVSNTPILTRWNSTMLIHEILTQLEDRSRNQAALCSLPQIIASKAHLEPTKLRNSYSTIWNSARRS